MTKNKDVSPEDAALEEAIESPSKRPKMIVDEVPVANEYLDGELGAGVEPMPIEAEVDEFIGPEPIHNDTLAAIEEATQVRELIDGRVSTYGDPIEGHVRIAQVWSGILGIEVQPATVPLLMIGMKLVRAKNAPDYSDNSDDIEGYLDIFWKIVGDDMIQARSVSEYLEKKAGRQ